MRFPIAVFALLLLTGAPVAADSADPASEPEGLELRLLDVPSDAAHDPRALCYIIDRVAPGAEIRRRVQIVNHTGTQQLVRLYPGAATIRDGSFIGEAAGADNELSSWTTLEARQLELPAGGSAEVLTTIMVPRVAPEAEHYAAVWAEMSSAGHGAQAGSVTAINRVGIRLYISVGPGNGRPPDFAIDSLTAARDTLGNPKLSAFVTNTGGRALDISGKLTLDDGPGQLSAGPFEAGKASTLAPGEGQEVFFSLPPEITSGPWTATVELKSGLLERTGSASVSFPGEGSAVAAVPVQEPHGALQTVLGAGLFLIAAAVATAVGRRRSRRGVPYSG